MKLLLSLLWSDCIAIYGAVLSTTLVFREWYLSRVSIEVSGFFTGDEQQPDIITIYNKSTKNIVIKDFSLFVANRKNRNGKEIQTGREGELINISIDSYASKKISFPDQYKISFHGYKNLYIRVRVMGKRNEITQIVK